MSYQINDADGLLLNSQVYIDSSGNLSLGQGETIDASAILELESTTQGFAPPRMTNLQRDTISNPLKGLVVYSIDDNDLYINTGTAGSPVWSAAGLGLTGSGNNTEVAYWSTGNNLTGDSNFYFNSGTQTLIVPNLTVNGTTTTVNSTTVTIDDPVFTIGGDISPLIDDNKDRGIEFRWHNGVSEKSGFFGFDDSTGRFTFIPDSINTGEVFSGALGDIEVNKAFLEEIQISTGANASSFLKSDASGNGVWTDILLADVTDVTATTAEVNLLDLSGLSVGWVLAADGAAAASWRQLLGSELNNDQGWTNNTGTVTSVGTAGTVNGLTLTGGPITTSGTITLGGTLSINNNDWSGADLAVVNGGTGVSTFGGTNTLLYTTSADTLSSITTANDSVLITNGTGIPSWETQQTGFNLALGTGAGQVAEGNHTHLLAAGATDVTATAAEVNLLDLSGLTAGWVLAADGPTSASWQAISTSMVPDGADGTAIHDNIAGEIAALTIKSSPISTDIIIIEDSGDSNNKKKVEIGSIPAASAATADTVIIPIRNDSGALIPKGAPLYITGYSVGFDRATVAVADADDPAKMPVIGLMQDDLANNSNGNAVIQGNISSFKTDYAGWTVGDIIYVSTDPTTNNGLTNTKPIGTAQVQKVGVVLRVHPSLGELGTSVILRPTGLPNIPDSQIWVGDSNGVPAAVSMSGDATLANTGAVTVNIPLSKVTDVTATAAEVNILDLSATSLTTGWGYFADGVSAASWRQLLGSEINNDQGWTSNTGTVTSVASGTGLSGGPITTSGTLNIDWPGLTDLTDAGVLSSTDTFAVYNISALAHEEATIAQLQTYMQNNLTFITDITGETLSDLSDIPAEPTGGSSQYILNYNDTGDVFTWVAQNTGFNLALGTGAGQVAEGNHTHLLAAGATDVTATAAEVNLLDLSGLTVGWVLAADGAAAASWRQLLGSELNNDQGWISNVVEDTTPQLGGMLDVNGFALGDGTNNLLTFKESGTANYFEIGNAGTGFGPTLSALGSDANIDVKISAKGTGNIILGTYEFDGDQAVGAGTDNYVLTYDNGTGLISLEPSTGGLNNIVEDTTPQLGGMLDVNGFAIGDGTLELITFTETGSAVNNINIANAATTGSPVISAVGDDANIGLSIQGKGTGNITLGNYVFDGDQTVGAGQDNYVLTYDNATGLISLEASVAGSSLGGLSDVTLTTPAQGDILYRNATEWVNLPAGTSGQVLQTNGAGANPSWVTPTGGANPFTKVSKAYTDFTAAATSESITLFTLTAGYAIGRIVLKHSTAFAGTGWTAATVEIGIAGDTAKYLEAVDVFQTAGSTIIFGSHNWNMENWDSGTTIQITLRTTGGNINAGTAGALDVYYEMVQIKGL